MRRMGVGNGRFPGTPFLFLGLGLWAKKEEPAGAFHVCFTLHISGTALRMRLQITFDSKTHPQGLPIHHNLKLKTGKP